MPSPPDFPDAADDATAAAFAEAPRLFARYRQLREVGRGGMGVVVLVFDEVLGIPLALKLVPDQLVRDTEGIEDLKKEVLRGMALTHPGIVRVHGFECDATHAAIVMEFVEGDTLADLKTREPGGCLDAAQLLPWVEQLCAILDYAHHDAKIAHRDLKPRNIMLTAAGRVKVADFGIASSLSDSLTRVSVRADSSGTPPFMSPQQVMGERPTARDDLYSLGATLYDLLTGRPPFFRGNILAQVMQEVPPGIAARRRELGVEGRAAIPEAWERLIAACLAKDPAARPESGAAILAALKDNSSRAVLPPLAPRSFPPLDGRDTTPVRELRPPPFVERPATTKRERPAPRPPSRWRGRLALVLTAAALTAGALHFVRHRAIETVPLPQPTPAPAAATPLPRATPAATGLQPAKGLDAPRRAP